jgi:chemotaxis protein CheX
VEPTELKQHLVDGLKSITSEVFNTMLSTSIEAGEARVSDTGPRPVEGVVGFVGMAGGYSGTGAVCAATPLACILASRLLMSEYNEINDDVLDAMAEITNMVIGGLKSSLEDHLGPMALSVPTIIYGNNFQTHSVSKREWVVIPFSFEGHQFEVTACLTRTPGERKPAFYVRQFAGISTLNQ